MSSSVNMNQSSVLVSRTMAARGALKKNGLRVDNLMNWEMFKTALHLLWSPTVQPHLMLPSSDICDKDDLSELRTSTARFPNLSNLRWAEGDVLPIPFCHPFSRLHRLLGDCSQKLHASDQNSGIIWRQRIRETAFCCWICTISKPQWGGLFPRLSRQVRRFRVRLSSKPPNSPTCSTFFLRIISRFIDYFIRLCSCFPPFCHLKLPLTGFDEFGGRLPTDPKNAAHSRSRYHEFIAYIEVEISTRHGIPTFIKLLADSNSKRRADLLHPELAQKCDHFSFSEKKRKFPRQNSEKFI